MVPASHIRLSQGRPAALPHRTLSSPQTVSQGGGSAGLDAMFGVRLITHKAIFFGVCVCVLVCVAAMLMGNREL